MSNDIIQDEITDPIGIDSNGSFRQVETLSLIEKLVKKMFPDIVTPDGIKEDMLCLIYNTELNVTQISDISILMLMSDKFGLDATLGQLIRNFLALNIPKDRKRMKELIDLVKSIGRNNEDILGLKADNLEVFKGIRKGL